jgi:molybdate transport system permease protein
MPIDWFPLWLSLRVAVISTAIALAIGLWLAWTLANRSFRGKEVLDAAVTLPLVLPPTVLGYYLLVLLGRASPIGHVYELLFGGPLVFTWQAAVVASLFHSTPLLVKSARAAFESVDRSYERAARNLGATELRLFWRVTLPLVRRSILSRGRAGLCPIAGRFRRHAHDRRQYSGPHPNGLDRHLRRRGSGQRRTARVLVLIVSAIALAILTLANRLTSNPFGPRQTDPGVMIQARIRKQYPPRPDSAGFSLDLDFQAAAGVTVLFGSSGAGKTLTLDSIAGFVRPDEGRILLDDQILFDGAAGVHLPPRSRHCGYVFQNYALFPHMTLRQNLEFAAERAPGWAGIAR